MMRVCCLCVAGLALLLTSAPLSAQYPVPLATFTGTVHSMDGKTLAVEDADGKTLQ